MRLGIHPLLNREAGGIYQYTVTMLEALDVLANEPSRFDEPDHWVVLTHDIDHPQLRELSGSHWTIQPFRPPGGGPGSAAATWPDPDRPQRQSDMHAWMKECGIEMMLYPTPHRLSFEADIPYVMAIHDLQHRLQPEFPEVSANGEWQRREYLFRNGVRNATLLIAESEVGREDILRFYGEYGVTAEQIKVLPYSPAKARAEGAACMETVHAKFGIPERFFFYPAQFWPHKNHLRIVQALGVLRHEHGLRIPIVFAGSASGELRARTRAEVLAEAQRRGVGEQVVDVGYVADDELIALYQAARALIMPTFFGPTNIPILEAWVHRCPALTSDIRGVRDQAGDAALLVDPRCVESLADGMRRLWTDEGLRSDLVARGEKRIGQYAAPDYRARLRDILNEAKDRVSQARTMSVGA